MYLLQLSPNIVRVSGDCQEPRPRVIKHQAVDFLNFDTFLKPLLQLELVLNREKIKNKVVAAFNKESHTNVFLEREGIFKYNTVK